MALSKRYMKDDKLQEKLGVFTIGHSNQDLDSFIRLLETKGIQVVVDIRRAIRVAGKYLISNRMVLF
jgi:hypothetical protein